MRKILSTITVFLLCASLTVVAAAFPVAVVGTPNGEFGLLVDDADLLTASEEAALLKHLTKISETYQAEVIVITLISLQGQEADDMVEMLYDELDYGCGDNRDGVMLMVSMAEREYRILSNGFAADAISVSDIDDMGDAIAPHLSDREYMRAFEEFADQCEYYLDGHINGFSFDFTGNLVIALVIGLIVSVITILILRGQLKSVKKQYQANAYIRDGSMNVTHASDLYLYRNVTRREKPKSSSGSGSGSSRNVGGGKF